MKINIRILLLSGFLIFSFSSKSQEFTVGSVKNDVLRIQGTPSSFDTNEFLETETLWYGASYVIVSTKSNRVIEWNNGSNNLRVVLRPGKNVTANRYLTIGSTRDDVLRIHGTPSHLDKNEYLGKETFWYGASYITLSLKTKQVIEWNNSLNNLKVRLYPEENNKPDNNRIHHKQNEDQNSINHQNYCNTQDISKSNLKIGSRREDVIKIQGKPDYVGKFENSGYEIFWYGQNSIKISLKTKKVISWNNNDNKLRVTNNNNDESRKTHASQSTANSTNSNPEILVRTFILEDDIYDVPINMADSLLKGFPLAKEVRSLKNGEKIYNIPLNLLPDFINEFPDAVPLKNYPQINLRLIESLQDLRKLYEYLDRKWIDISFAEYISELKNESNLVTLYNSLTRKDNLLMPYSQFREFFTIDKIEMYDDRKSNSILEVANNFEKQENGNRVTSINFIRDQAFLIILIAILFLSASFYFIRKAKRQKELQNEFFAVNDQDVDYIESNTIVLEEKLEKSELEIIANVDTTEKKPKLKKWTSYVIAIIVCVVLWILYAVIAVLLGWKNGGGALPLILFFSALVWVWKKITGLNKK